MNALMWIHIAAGSAALLAGTAAAVASKGAAVHAKAGTLFVVSMLVLGVSASILEPYRTPPGSPVGGIMVCYFVLTAWVAARRRDGVTGRFEMAACAAALVTGGLIAWGALNGATTPAGSGPVFIFAGICLLAGLLDLNVVLRGKMTPAQRVSRHIWRMCVAFFIATGSFFLGQQDALPAAVRGSPALLIPAFAPFGLMLFWLVRLRFAKMVGRLTLRTPFTPVAATAEPSAPRLGEL